MKCKFIVNKSNWICFLDTCLKALPSSEKVTGLLTISFLFLKYFFEYPFMGKGGTFQFKMGMFSGIKGTLMQI